MDFLKVIEKRHSVRKFTDTTVERETLDKIIDIALTAPSSRNSKSSAFMIIEDKDTLVALSELRDYGGAFIKDAAAAILVLGDASKTDLWVDNCAISATFIQLAVTSMGLGSCWVHVNNRLREKNNPEAGYAQDYVAELLGVKNNFRPYSVIAIGHPQE